MRINDYIQAGEEEKSQWVKSINMSVGLSYFGGKSKIGKYLLNKIFNMTVQMKQAGKRPDIFIDAFCGGGKMGLTIPYGWYDTIVMNDLDRGVYNYYKYCQGRSKETEHTDYKELISMIEKIGETMSEDVFHMCARQREKKEIDDLSSAAMTFWTTQASWLGDTNPYTISYSLKPPEKADEALTKGLLKKNEQQEIQKCINEAYKRIPKLHDRFMRQNFIIENLDYRELIKKYNGMSYEDTNGEKHRAEELGKKIKIWYFDPPYHPCTLAGENSAPYADTFSEAMTNEMTKILHGDFEEEYGTLDYFMKSDYDPKSKVPETHECYHDFDCLEVPPFCKICVGSFDKGAVDGKGVKTIGNEYIWCRGYSEQEN
ncbi:DNA adenine methylase [Eisenbergiella tayi]|uniref:DNA adenine methylase n=1 Tax=Eisenbergiella tayi TaxID=1432052 RepID=UPI000849630C|nr:DNA adenine methylase [Eisenbergiella tayi]ODR38509.1 hypothetical protein BEI60_08570 [Eisenbergiella tayi]